MLNKLVLDKLSEVSGATTVGLGLVVAVNESGTVPMPLTAEFELTAWVPAIGGLGYEAVEPELTARVAGGRFGHKEHLIGLPWPGELAPFNGTLTLNQSVAAGLESLEPATRNTPGKKILASEPNGRSAEEISFVVLGDADPGVFKQLRGLTLPIFDYPVPGITPAQRRDGRLTRRQDRDRHAKGGGASCGGREINAGSGRPRRRRRDQRARGLSGHHHRDQDRGEVREK